MDTIKDNLVETAMDTVIETATSTLAGIAIKKVIKTFVEHFEPHGSKTDDASIRFLNYGTKFIFNQYKNETPYEPYLAYTHLLDLQKKQPEIRLNKKPFSIKNNVDEKWRNQRVIAHSAWRNSLLRTHESKIVRLSVANAEYLKISEASYFDQGKSNLILDYEENDGSQSLRELLRNECNYTLPRINDARLANTVGLAAILYYRHRGGLFPYLTYRAPGQAYLPNGGVHCTASCVAPWPASIENCDFQSVFNTPMLKNIQQVTGISRGDLGQSGLMPTSLSREWIRAGKPQIFFTGFVNLSRAELKTRRKLAVSSQGNRPDIEKKNAPHVKNVELQGQNLENVAKKYKMSMECLASIEYSKLVSDLLDKDSTE